jgi:2-amino-4-hydroxy-6-hydroxymethyldihydropteridine diphosphokinase
MAKAAIALGGNVGDIAVTFDRAIVELCRAAPARLLARSANFSTPPWGEEAQPSFLNACILVETRTPPRELLARMHEIERAHGRDRTRETRWGPRTLDLDLLTYDDLEISAPDLTLPHPRLAERGFVLAPLAEIAPEMVVRGRAVADHLALVPLTGIKRLATPNSG